MNNVIVRSLSGLVYVAVFVACILCGRVWFLILTEMLILGGLAEYMRLGGDSQGDDNNGMTTALASFTATALCLSCYFVTGVNTTALFICVVALVAGLCLILGRAVTSTSAFALHHAKDAVVGLVYIALPLSALNIVYSSLPAHEGMMLILLSLICIWVNDTGAFCVGCTIGRHRLCERLSPKKSWEGFWGGIVLVVVGMGVYALIEGRNIPLYIAYGAIVSVLATIGDLFESLLKRKAGVKDSGNLIPGHGGILDRIDSFLFVAYAIILMALIVGFGMLDIGLNHSVGSNVII